MDFDRGYTLCKGKDCNREFRYIRKHLAQSKECEAEYTKDELFKLKEESQKFKANKDRAMKKLKYDKDKRFERYLREREQIKTRYQQNKRKISNKYEENKSRIAQKYKEKQAEKVSRINSHEYDCMTEIFGKVFEKAADLYLDQFLVEVKSRFTNDTEKKAVDFWKNEKQSGLTDVIQITTHGKIWNKVSGGQFDTIFKEIYDEAFDLAYSKRNKRKKELGPEFDDKLTENISKLSLDGPFFDKISSIIHIEIEKQRRIRIIELKSILEKQERERNLGLKEKYLKQLDLQIKLIKDPSKEVTDQIHRIRLNIESLFKRIDLQLDEANEKIRDLHHFIDIRNLFDNFKVYEAWKNDEASMELTNVPCQCNTCVKNLHNIEWCNRVMRERKKGQKEYTCPGYQKFIDKYVFEIHLDTCTKKQ